MIAQDVLPVLARAVLVGLAAYYLRRALASPGPQYLIGLAPPLARLRGRAELADELGRVWPALFYCATCTSLWLAAALTAVLTLVIGAGTGEEACAVVLAAAGLSTAISAATEK